MDEAHEAELRRIIENRRRRGSLKSLSSDLFGEGTERQPRKLVLPVRAVDNDVRSAASPRASPQRGAAATSNQSPQQINPSASRRGNFRDPQQDDGPQRPPGPSVTPRQLMQTQRVSFLNSVTSNDKNARESQALQEKKVDQLQDELRSGLSEIRRALNTVIQEQRHGPPSAPIPLAYASMQSRGGGGATPKYTNSIMGSGPVSAEYDEIGSHDNGPNAYPRSQAHLVDTPRGGDGRNALASSFRSMDHPHSATNRYRGGQEMDLRSSPLVIDSSVIPGQKLGPAMDSTSKYQQALRKQSSAMHMQPKFSSPAARQHYHAAPAPSSLVDTSYAAAASSKPFQPPISARPFSKTTIDLQSSLTVLSEGEWWYKWDSTGEKVKLRWVWLDPSRRSLSWSEKQISDPPLFGPRIPMEEVQRVTTTQITETDPHGNPRIFYVLLIECTVRLLQLGTERRDKLDMWYEAISTVIHGTRQAMHSRIASSMGSE